MQHGEGFPERADNILIIIQFLQHAKGCNDQRIGPVSGQITDITPDDPEFVVRGGLSPAVAGVDHFSGEFQCSCLCACRRELPGDAGCTGTQFKNGPAESLCQPQVIPGVVADQWRIKYCSYIIGFMIQ